MATLDMLDEIEANVMQRCSTYFRDVYGSAPEPAKQILQQLSIAEGERCEMDKLSKRWLLRRLLITEQQQLAIPVFGHWVRVFAEDF